MSSHSSSDYNFQVFENFYVDYGTQYETIFTFLKVS